MLTSVRWLNDYLDPPADADTQADLLTRAGFPLEGSERVEVGDGEDVRQDFEMTSNRGDCICHVGLAREIAAISRRRLQTPAAAPETSGPAARDLIRVTNHEHGRCPLYTGRVIRGVRIAPSPAWLADRLRGRGDIPRNNVVDATNFVLFESGQPTHVFDLATLEGAEIIIRMARPGEAFLPIGEGEKEVTLTADDLVIADAGQAVAIAGVKGGALTAVTEGTTDLVLEAASFDPVSVRNTSRRHGIASESSYRFERGVPPGQVDAAAERLAALILELAGGELCEGVVSAGAPIPERRRVAMRIRRCGQLLGVDIGPEEMIDVLTRLGFEPRLEEGTIDCLVPVHRIDIEREIDLVEEVGRMYGYDRIPVTETIQIRVAPPQPTERGRQAVQDALVGMGFVETVTHSLVSEEMAAPFSVEGQTPLKVRDDRAGAEPVLQPSVLPSLLRVRRLNADNGIDRLDLFEQAAAFRPRFEGNEETVELGLLMDLDRPDDGLRPMRGVIARLVEILCGDEARLDVRTDDTVTWLRPGATVVVGGRLVGRFGVLAPEIGTQTGLDHPLAAATLDLTSFYEGYPPETTVQPLPVFPVIERDLSIIVDDALTWAEIERGVDALHLEHLETAQFVTTFRGRSIEPGRKSLTFRLRFRHPNRTLTHDEVDQQMTRTIETLRTQWGAELRQ